MWCFWYLIWWTNSGKQRKLLKLWRSGYNIRIQGFNFLLWRLVHFFRDLQINFIYCFHFILSQTFVTGNHIDHKLLRFYYMDIFELSKFWFFFVLYVIWFTEVKHCTPLLIILSAFLGHCFNYELCNAVWNKCNWKHAQNLF